VEHLDSLFTMYPSLTASSRKPEDITREGIIGNYVHGNEPSHHVAYLYNHAGAPRKATVQGETYNGHQVPAGARRYLSGNDDCGQMSAWVHLQCTGSTRVAGRAGPGSDRYDLGSPAGKGGHHITGKRKEVYGEGM
jgi:putative alpha-1,2-mannosidase